MLKCYPTENFMVEGMSLFWPWPGPGERCGHCSPGQTSWDGGMGRISEVVRRHAQGRWQGDWEESEMIRGSSSTRMPWLASLAHNQSFLPMGTPWAQPMGQELFPTWSNFVQNRRRAKWGGYHEKVRIAMRMPRAPSRRKGEQKNKK